MDLSHEISEAGKKWSELNGDAQLLEEMKHSVRAEIGNQSNESSAAAKEQYALRHEEYTGHIQRMVFARTKANIAKARWEGFKE